MEQKKKIANSDRISFRLVAYTDAAGKYNPAAVRNGNEDNFFVNSDLATELPKQVPPEEIIHLGPLGMLMAVADGMGGMNAGEIASQIAIDTVKECFKINLLSPDVVATTETRKKYLERVIKQADQNIKEDASQNHAHEGMGSTIILAWLYNSELIISWCGDSRAYIYNDKSGIRLVSHDHSYVQELVNKGILTYDQTFDHPQNNIVTRSLGDPTKDAKPESRILHIGKGDIILLCSDGLSGVLRDRKTYDSSGNLCPEENIEDIIRAHTDSIKVCREALWSAAERGEWYDNVTAILCQITDGPQSVWTKTTIEKSARTYKKVVLCIIGVLILAAALWGAFILGKYCRKDINPIVSADSLNIEATDSLYADSIALDLDTMQSLQPTANKIISGESSIFRKHQQNSTRDSTVNTTNELTPIEKDSIRSNTDKLLPAQDKRGNIILESPIGQSKSQSGNQQIITK
jgi:protein phosphatase